MFNSDINSTIQRISGIPTTSSQVQVALDQIYGLGVGGGIHFDLAISVLSIRVSGDYLTLSPDKDKFKNYVQVVVPGLPVQFVDGGRVDMYSGNANAKLTVIPLPVFKPYVTGGIGLAHVKAQDVKLSVGSLTLPPVTILKEQTVGTFNAGAGLDLALSGVTIFLELKANWILLDEGTSTFVPIVTAGLTF
jgi:opacity protein-like surface antigen